MTDVPPTIYCANHPTVETTLRCNRCEKPICTRCAVLTPTGYRCKECVRGQQKIFDTAQWFDYPLVIVISGILAFIGSQLANVLGFFTLFIAPIAGVIIAEAVRLVIRRRRGKRLFQVAALATVVGALPLPLIHLLSALPVIAQFGVQGVFSLLPLLWQGVYLFMVAPTVYYRLGGIQMR